jgi:hypothetical protein
MAFDLPLSRQLAKAGWKVKIRDKERLEEPHLTILKGTRCWRLSMRSGQFLDDGSWNDLPERLRAQSSRSGKRFATSGTRCIRTTR